MPALFVTPSTEDLRWLLLLRDGPLRRHAKLLGSRQ